MINPLDDILILELAADLLEEAESLEMDHYDIILGIDE